MSELKIYLLSQNVNKRYDTFDEFIVVSESRECAILIRPDNIDWEKAKKETHGSWVVSPVLVEVKEIGICTDESYKEGDIICASFNAG